MKSFYRVSTKQHEHMKSSVLRSKTQPFCKLGVLARTCEIPTIPTDT